MNPSKLVGVRELIVKYDIFFIDLWGVIHNGKKIFENAIEVLKNIKNQGKVIVLISNAPRPSTTVKSFLLKMGFDFSLIDELVTSGDVTRNYLEENKIKKFYHLGPDKDRDIFNQNNQLSKSIQDCDEIICTGLNNAEEEIEIYDRLLKENIKYKKKKEPLNINVAGNINILNKKIYFENLIINEETESSEDDLRFFKKSFENILFDEKFTDIFELPKIQKFILEIS